MVTFEGRTFDRIPVFDERSRAYSVAEVVSTTEGDVEKVWRTGPIINQGSEGACVGFAWTNEFTADPKPDEWADVDVATKYAFNHYHRARDLDDFDNNVYPSGSSVLGGAKAAVERGFIEEYRWAFSTEYVKLAVMQQGPVVLGIPWYWEMYSTDEAGRVIVHHDMNNFVGGHAILLTGYYPVKTFVYPDGRRETVEQVFRWTNSWGPGYGDGGHGYLTFDDVHRLLNTYGHPGEACLPLQRQPVDLERFLDPTIPPRPEPEPEPEDEDDMAISIRDILDVTRRHPRAHFIRRAVNLGLMDLTKDKKFLPTRHVTRAQQAEALVRLHDKLTKG